MSPASPFITQVKETDRGHSEACSPPRVALVVYDRDGARLVQLLPQQPVVVGRSLPSDVVVEDPMLSRSHARFSWEKDGVWVEDLGSTNGTQLGGKKVRRARFHEGDRVRLGDVHICLQTLSSSEPSLEELDSHDRFLVRLEEEITRARTFGRPLAVLMLRALDPARDHVSGWGLSVRKLLRPVDRVGWYGPASIMAVLPETDEEHALKVAAAAAHCREQARSTLAVGVALFPHDGATAEELVERVRAAAQGATARKNVQLVGAPRAATSSGQARLVVKSPAMRSLFETARRLASSPIPVLIQGETGTGKELFARALHDEGGRRKKPLRSVNCGAIPATLMESVVFGHERGAFTGADRLNRGVFEQADGGTVFLDEIGELSAAAQAALLRVLETRRLTRVGSDAEIEIDVRVVAATHRDLEAMCQAGAFRWDLLYRLNAMILQILPLRERPEEILPLAELFLAEARRANAAQVRGLAPETEVLLQAYHWPGNVRELRNVIERAVVICRGHTLLPADLSERVRAARGKPSASAFAPGEPGLGYKEQLKQRVQQYEVELILEALAKTEGNQTKAAGLLGMPLRTLVHKIGQHGIKRRFGPG